jgi:cysteine desulfuration protein SufE
MYDATTGLPRLDEIVQDFQWAEGREKLELLIQYAESLPALPEHLQQERAVMEAVPECMTPVFIHTDCHNGQLTYYLDVPESSPTVRGYASILSQGLAGATPEQVLTLPANFYTAMGLHQVLTQQRLNGIEAILAHMKALAMRHLATNG